MKQIRYKFIIFSIIVSLWFPCVKAFNWNGIGGTDMVIGEAGTTVALAGGGIPGMAIPIGGGTDIIGGAGYPAGAPSLVSTDPTTIGNSEEDSTYLFIFKNDQ